MTDEPDNLILRYLRRIDATVERLASELTDVKRILTSLERQVGELGVDIAAAALRPGLRPGPAKGLSRPRLRPLDPRLG